MKKLLALLMAAVMCLSFAACGGNADSNENDGTQSNEQADSENTENENSESPYADHPQLAYLYGQWVLKGRTITINLKFPAPQ